MEQKTIYANSDNTVRIYQSWDDYDAEEVYHLWKKTPVKKFCGITLWGGDWKNGASQDSCGIPSSSAWETRDRDIMARWVKHYDMKENNNDSQNSSKV